MYDSNPEIYNGLIHSHIKQKLDFNGLVLPYAVFPFQLSQTQNVLNNMNNINWLLFAWLPATQKGSGHLMS